LAAPLLEFAKAGIYCPAGDFYIDPWYPVPRAIITHAHSDHARPGHSYYLAHEHSAAALRLRLGAHIDLRTVAYGQVFYKNGVKLSLHPAGHIWGAAQVRVEHRGQVWVVSGDYKLEADGMGPAFEPVRCHTFVTESTFGLPVFKWKPQAVVYQEINEWVVRNQAQGLSSVLLGYSLGKAQRLHRALDPSLGPVYGHGAIVNTHEALLAAGLDLPPLRPVTPALTKKELTGSLVLAPPSVQNSTWLNRFGPYAIGVASGWMNLRGNKRRQAADRGFVLSDHADWPDLLAAIAATGAERVLVTHGYTDIFSRFLREQGLDAQAVETLFEGEVADKEETKAEAPTPG
jgi:putative mRNA 3-end processing factor